MPHPRRKVVVKGFIEVYDGFFPKTADHVSETLHQRPPDYTNDYLQNVPEIVRVRVTVEEIRSFGKALTLNDQPGRGQGA